MCGRLLLDQPPTSSIYRGRLAHWRQRYQLRECQCSPHHYYPGPSWCGYAETPDEMLRHPMGKVFQGAAAAPQCGGVLLFCLVMLYEANCTVLAFWILSYQLRDVTISNNSPISRQQPARGTQAHLPIHYRSIKQQQCRPPNLRQSAAQ